MPFSSQFLNFLIMKVIETSKFDITKVLNNKEGHVVYHIKAHRRGKFVMFIQFLSLLVSKLQVK